MTEQQWLVCTDPEHMLSFLGDRLSRRKRLLFACGCVRRVWHLIEDSTCQRAVIVAERYADGLATEEERTEADEAVAQGDGRGTPYGPADLAATFSIIADGNFADVDSVLRHPTINAARFVAKATGTISKEIKCQSALLRDIAGNPFHSLPLLDLTWLTWNENILRRLADAIYEDRLLPTGTLDAGRLAVVADALEEGGCDNEEILAHLRQQGVSHYRGCWVIDLLLNKS